MKAVTAPAPCDSLPPARVHLQEVPQLSRAAPPAEGPSVEACHGPVGGISYSSRDREEARSVRVSQSRDGETLGLSCSGDRQEDH